MGAQKTDDCEVTAAVNNDDSLLADPDAIAEALYKGVKKAVWLHKRLGHPVVIWQDGKVVSVPPEELPDFPRPENIRF